MQFGRYQVVRVLGQGATSTVYEAVDPKLNKQVAIKALHVALLASSELVSRFESEAHIANGVRHAGVIEIFELDRLPNGTVYQVMEFLDGESLAQRIVRRTTARLELDEIYRIVRQLGETLCAVHMHGIIHRDLKPDNVMLVRDELVPGGARVKLLDFGVAKIRNHQDKPLGFATKAGIGLGTVDYMPPEQILDARNTSDRADVYSLGCILFELLAGRKVFQGEDYQQILGGHLTRPAPDLFQFASGLPSELGDLLHAMLEKNADRRPTMRQTVSQLDCIWDAWSRQGSDTIVIRPRSIALLESMHEAHHEKEADVQTFLSRRRRLRGFLPILFAGAAGVFLPIMLQLPSCATGESPITVEQSAKKLPKPFPERAASFQLPREKSLGSFR